MRRCTSLFLVVFFLGAAVLNAGLPTDADIKRLNEVRVEPKSFSGKSALDLVKWLRDESKKADPTGVGVTFQITPAAEKILAEHRAAMVEKIKVVPSIRDYMRALTEIGVVFDPHNDGEILVRTNAEQEEFLRRMEAFVDGMNKSIDRAIDRLSKRAEELEKRKTAIREWQAKLEAQRLALRPGDAAGKLKFDTELTRYLAELESLKKDMERNPRL